MDVLDKIKNGDYKNKKQYPVRANFKIMKLCEYCGQSYKDKKSEEEYKNAHREYRIETSTLMKQFRNDLFEEAEIIEHPKADKIWNLAWERGHSSGLAEVYDYFFEYLDLIK